MPGHVRRDLVDPSDRCASPQAYSDHSDLISRRMGFIPLPLGALLLRIISASVQVRGSMGLLIGLLVYLWYVARHWSFSVSSPTKPASWVSPPFSRCRQPIFSSRTLRYLIPTEVWPASLYTRWIIAPYLVRFAGASVGARVARRRCSLCHAALNSLDLGGRVVSPRKVDGQPKAAKNGAVPRK